ncbi:MAG: NYN domain-containing protein [Candidatus Delongbacteria bacterium]|nr:NYN domain-containing protein [Candidatus Delongbacteria bacterium]
MERVALFIDGNHIHSAQRYLRWSIDWVKFRQYFDQEYDLIEADYYRTLRNPHAPEERNFGKFLATNGYHLRENVAQRAVDKVTGERIQKGNLDVDLVIDAITSTEQWDIAVLVTGAESFVPLIRALREREKVVQVYTTSQYASPELLTAAGDDLVELEAIREIVERTDRPPKPLPAERPTVMHQRTSGYDAPPRNRQAPPTRQGLPEVGEELEVSIIHGKPYGVFVRNPWSMKILLPVSELPVDKYVADIAELFEQEDLFRVRITEVDTSKSEPEAKVTLADDRMLALIRERFERLQNELPQLPDKGVTYRLRVSHVEKYGAFLDNEWEAKVLLHVSNLGINRFIRDCTVLFEEGEMIQIDILEIRNPAERMLSVTLNDAEFAQKLSQRLDQLESSPR